MDTPLYVFINPRSGNSKPGPPEKTDYHETIKASQSPAVNTGMKLDTDTNSVDKDKWNVVINSLFIEVKKFQPYDLDESHVQKAFNQAVNQCKISKIATAHTF